MQISFGPAEFVKEVCGAYGNHNGIVIVKFLTFVTNEGTYGPYGRTTGTPFNADVPKDQSIVGFFGRADDTQLIAFGVYTV